MGGIKAGMPTEFEGAFRRRQRTFFSLHDYSRWHVFSYRYILHRNNVAKGSRKN